RRKCRRVTWAAFVASVSSPSSQLVVAHAESAADPPCLVPWTRIGNIRLDERRTHAESEYGSVGTGSTSRPATSGRRADSASAAPSRLVHVAGPQPTV